jgi:hypothetical protein
MTTGRINQVNEAIEENLLPRKAFCSPTTTVQIRATTALATAKTEEE